MATIETFKATNTIKLNTPFKKEDIAEIMGVTRKSLQHSFKVMLNRDEIKISDSKRGIYIRLKQVKEANDDRKPKGAPWKFNLDSQCALINSFKIPVF